MKRAINTFMIALMALMLLTAISCGPGYDNYQVSPMLENSGMSCAIELVNGVIVISNLNNQKMYYFSKADIGKTSKELDSKKQIRCAKLETGQENCKIRVLEQYEKPCFGISNVNHKYNQISYVYCLIGNGLVHKTDFHKGPYTPPSGETYEKVYQGICLENQ